MGIVRRNPSLICSDSWNRGVWIHASWAGTYFRMLPDASVPVGQGLLHPLSSCYSQWPPLCLGPQVIYEVHQIRNLLPLPPPHTNAFPFSTAPGLPNPMSKPGMAPAFLSGPSHWTPVTRASILHQTCHPPASGPLNLLFTLWEHFALTPHSTAAAAAAKLLQSCPTLCDPIDGSPPGSSIPENLQARTVEWVAISFSSAWKWKF